MFGFIKGALGSLFSSDKVVDTGIRIIDKIAGTDGMTAQEKAQFVLQYQEATKHQSPTRRLIAFVLTGLYALFAVMYLIFTSVGKIFSLPGFHLAAKDILEFLTSSINQPFNIVLVFYFTVQIANSLKGR